MQLTDKTTLDNNISVSNVEIPRISNEIAPFTCVEPVNEQHLDMHHEHAMNASMTMDFVAILI
jgi:hypothetical protein